MKWKLLSENPKVVEDRKELTNVINTLKGLTEKLMLQEISQTQNRTTEINTTERITIEDFVSSNSNLSKNENLDGNQNILSTLIKINNSSVLDCSFLKILNKNKKSSCWVFWKDITCFLRDDVTDQKKFKEKFSFIIENYFMENSLHKVNLFFFPKIIKNNHKNKNKQNK